MRANTLRLPAIPRFRADFQNSRARVANMWGFAGAGLGDSINGRDAEKGRFDALRSH